MSGKPQRNKHNFLNIPTKLPTLLSNVTSVLFVSEIKHDYLPYMCILSTLAFTKRKKKSADTEMNIGRGNILKISSQAKVTKAVTLPSYLDEIFSKQWSFFLGEHI